MKENDYQRKGHKPIRYMKKPTILAQGAVGGSE